MCKTKKQFLHGFQKDLTTKLNQAQFIRQSKDFYSSKGTDKSLSISTDCNGSNVYLNPRQGGMMAVAEAARNVVCSGAEPLAITNCLNFGNPQDPEIYWQFKEAVLGMGDMCRKLNTPVTGGNVSFYNETVESAVYPTPVIGMVGEVKNKFITTHSYKNEGDLIVMLGSFNVSLGGSSYLKTLHNTVLGPLANFDMNLEYNVQRVCLDSINSGIINSAHDISDGGLSVNIAESVIASNGKLGAHINIESRLNEHEILFGECASIIIVTLNSNDLAELILFAKKYNVITSSIGYVSNDSKLIINDSINLSKNKISDSFNNSLEKLMSSENNE